MFRQIILLIIPLITCGDEVSDIIYIIQNWDSFANIYLKVFCMIFLIAPFVLIIIFLKATNTSRNCILVDTFLVWTKIQFSFCMEETVTVDDVIYAKDRRDQITESIKQIKDQKRRLHAQQFFQTFIEDIPQLILQISNNSQTNSWSPIQKVSICLSSMMIFVNIVLFLYSTYTGSQFFEKREERQFEQAQKTNKKFRQMQQKNKRRLQQVIQRIKQLSKDQLNP